MSTRGMIVLAAAMAVLPARPVCASAESIDLTGKWTINFDGTYYLRQIGTEVWWIGESNDGGKSWTNIGHGFIKDDELNMKWADSPRGSNNGTGSLVLHLVVKDGRVVRIKKKKQVGDDFGGDTFERAP